MGASSFVLTAKGRTAKEAFDNATDDARHQFGHGGYTGSIAEKNGFRMIPLPAGCDAGDYVEELLNNDDPRIEDKYGPAGCIALGGDEYLFFGYASS